MKKFQGWSAIGAAVAGVALSGCGGSGDSSSDVSVRLANATLTHSSLSLLVNSSTALTATATDTVSSYTTTGAGTVALQVNDNGGSTSLVTSQPSLTGGLHYVLVAYESGNAVRTALINEDYTVGVTGATSLRILDLATEAGKLDVYVTPLACNSTNLSTTSATGTFTPSLLLPLTSSQGNGTANICVTGQGNKSDIRLAMPVTFVGAQAVTVLLTPASGGQLLNGSVVVQQGAYAATRNTNARVRLAAAVTSGASVAVTSSSGVVVDSGSAAPNFGFYTLVPAADTLNISVNGASVGAPATALTAGGDATVLVYGNATAPTTTLLADDNRAPTDSTTAKVRLINGVTGSTGTLTLTAGGSAPIGIAVAPGTASAYATITPASTTATSLQLSSSTAGSCSNNTDNTFIANSVYSILATGDLSAGSCVTPSNTGTPPIRLQVR